MAKKKTATSVETPSPEEPTPPKGKGRKPTPANTTGEPRIETRGRKKRLRTAQEQAQEQAKETRKQAKEAEQRAIAQRHRVKTGRPWVLEQDPAINERLQAVLDSLDGGMTNEERLIRGLQSGVPVEIACEYAGIERQQYYKWRKEYNKDPESVPESVAQFLTISKQIHMAKAVQAQEAWWKIIEEGKGNFIPICTYLERTQNDFYSQNKHKTENIQIHASTVIQTKTAQEAAERYQRVSAEYKKQEDILKAIDVEPIKEGSPSSSN